MPYLLSVEADATVHPGFEPTRRSRLRSGGPEEEPQMHDDSDDPRSAHARAKAAKAHAKALRPWYRKKRFIGLGVLAALFAVGVASSGSGGDEPAEVAATTDADAAGATDDGPRTMSGNTEFPPGDDVEISSCQVDDVLGWPSADLSITNNSPEPSDYMVSVNFTVDGVKIGEGAALSSNVDPGQRAVATAQGTGDVGDGQAVTCEIVEVERFAS
jgi:hypothetical protein